MAAPDLRRRREQLLIAELDRLRAERDGWRTLARGLLAAYTREVARVGRLRRQARDGERRG